MIGIPHPGNGSRKKKGKRKTAFTLPLLNGTAITKKNLFLRLPERFKLNFATKMIRVRGIKSTNVDYLELVLVLLCII